MSIARKLDSQVQSHHQQMNTHNFDHPLKNVFRSKSYQINQPFFQITKEGYDIASSDQSEVYSAVRPRHIFRSLVGRAAGIFALLATIAFSFAFGIRMTKMIHSESAKAALTLAVVFAVFALGIGAYIVVSRLASPRRKLSLFAKQFGDAALMTIHPTSSIFIFEHEYHVQDQQGNVLLVCRKSLFDSFFLKKWHVYSPQNKYIFSAVEDSLFKAILRNYMGFGRFIPLHFKFVKGQGQFFGEFIRRFSIRDKYKLYFDNAASVDSWMLVATALLLDTGEER